MKQQRRARLWAPLLKALGTTLGNAAGGPVAGALGGELGSAAGDYFARLTGFGDYKVSRNSLVSAGNLTSVPRFGSSKVRIRHVEYISDVKGSQDFQLTATKINPGNPQMFPWLSNIARHYEKWRPHGIVFCYRSTSGSATGSDTSLGTVVMATNYDVKDADFQSKREMEAYEFCTSGGPDNDALHPIECKSSSLPLKQYIVSTEQDPGDDPRFHHMGNFQIATIGQPINDATLGELWIAYDIELSTPKLSPNASTVFWHAFGYAESLTHLMKDPYVYPGSTSSVWLHNAGTAGEAVHFQHTGYYMITLSFAGGYTSRAPFAPDADCVDVTNTCGFWLNDPQVPQVFNTSQGDLVDRIIIHVRKPNSRCRLGTVGTSYSPNTTATYLEVIEIPASMMYIQHASTALRDHTTSHPNDFISVPPPTHLQHSESKSSGTRTPGRR